MGKTDVDVAVVGGGAAGLVAAAGTAALGARTVLIERNRLGGECTWTGCIPSKALLHVASLAATARKSNELGVHSCSVDIDFKEVMESVHSVRRNVYEHGETPGYLKELGIRPLHASARFLDSGTLEIERNGRTRVLSFRSAIIATGSRPFVPDIEGLQAVPHLTTNELFEIDELPRRLAILGCGAVGVEIGQAFARLGSEVTLITRDDQLLSEVDRDAAVVLQGALEEEGIDIHLLSTITNVSQSNGQTRIEVSGAREPFHLNVDQLLIATGRIANTAGIGLDAAGISYDRYGIGVDSYCRTNVRGIFASGDVTPAPNLTHIAENMSKAAAVNALARIPVWKYERDVVPAVIYTDPEVASVGRCRQDLDADGADYDVIDFPYYGIDRAVIEGNTDGFVRVYHRFGKILGATIVGAGAGELISEYALAMRQNIRLPAIAGTVHAYPTMMLGARRAADQMYIRSLKPWMVRAFRFIYGYRGDVPDYVGTRKIV